MPVNKNPGSEGRGREDREKSSVDRRRAWLSRVDRGVEPGVEARIASAPPARRGHGRLREVDRRQAAGDFNGRAESDARRVAAGVGGGPRNEMTSAYSHVTPCLHVSRLFALRPISSLTA